VKIIIFTAMTRMKTCLATGHLTRPNPLFKFFPGPANYIPNPF